MRSVPPRGSGGVSDCRLSIADFRFALAMKPIGNRKSKIKNPETHPLRRGGTDLMGPRHELLCRIDALTRFERRSSMQRLATNLTVAFLTFVIGVLLWFADPLRLIRPQPLEPLRLNLSQE